MLCSRFQRWAKIKIKCLKSTPGKFLFLIHSISDGIKFSIRHLHEFSIKNHKSSSQRMWKRLVSMMLVVDAWNKRRIGNSTLLGYKKKWKYWFTSQKPGSQLTRARYVLFHSLASKQFVVGCHFAAETVVSISKKEKTIKCVCMLLSK